MITPRRLLSHPGEAAIYLDYNAGSKLRRRKMPIRYTPSLSMESTIVKTVQDLQSRHSLYLMNVDGKQLERVVRKVIESCQPTSFKSLVVQPPPVKPTLAAHRPVSPISQKLGSQSSVDNGLLFGNGNKLGVVSKDVPRIATPMAKSTVVESVKEPLKQHITVTEKSIPPVVSYALPVNKQEQPSSAESMDRDATQRMLPPQNLKSIPNAVSVRIQEAPQIISKQVEKQLPISGLSNLADLPSLSFQPQPNTSRKNEDPLKLQTAKMSDPNASTDSIDRLLRDDFGAGDTDSELDELDDELETPRPKGSDQMRETREEAPNNKEISQKMYEEDEFESDV